MGKPQTWDSGLRWDSGLVWGGVAPTPTRMNNVKAIIDFTGYTDADLAPVAQAIHDDMVAAATTFTTPPVAMPALLSLIETFKEPLI